MSLYSDMTDARSPKNIVFMEGDSDSWGYYVDGKGNKFLQQYNSEGELTGTTLTIVSFDAENPDQIEIRWPDANGSARDVVNELNSRNTKGGISGTKTR